MDCGGCEAALATKVGAQVAVIGWVQKVSNLILNINVVIRDASSGAVLHAGSVDIRGNTDEFLVTRALLSRQKPAAEQDGRMTLMLASVRGPEEAAVALAAGADIIDLKDPARGALGAVDVGTVRETVAIVAGARPVSAVTGDTRMDPAVVRAAVEAMTEAGIDYVKQGIFPGGDPAACIRALSPIAARARLVAVLFADRGPDFSLLPVLAAAGLRGELDTGREEFGAAAGSHGDDRIASLRAAMRNPPFEVGAGRFAGSARRAAAAAASARPARLPERPLCRRGSHRAHRP